MAPDLLLPSGVVVGGLVLELVLLAGLVIWRQQQPGNLVGQVRADVALVLLRALLLLLVGLALGLCLAAGWLPRTQPLPLPWVALGLVAIGWIGFVVRVAHHWLRIKPDLERLSVPVVPVSPVIDAQGEGPREERSSRAKTRRVRER